MKHSTAGSGGLFLSCIRAQAVWFLSALILLPVMGLIAYSTADPDSLIRPLSLCALYLSALIGGIAAVRYSGDGAASGLLSGTMTAFLLLLVSAFPLPESGFEPNTGFLLLALVIPASLIGSVLGHRRTGRKPKSRVRR